MTFQDGVISDSEPELLLNERSPSPISSDEDELNILNTKRKTETKYQRIGKRAKVYDLVNHSHDVFPQAMVVKEEGQNDSEASTDYDEKGDQPITPNPSVIKVPIRRPGVNLPPLNSPTPMARGNSENEVEDFNYSDDAQIANNDFEFFSSASPHERRPSVDSLAPSDDDPLIENLNNDMHIPMNTAFSAETSAALAPPTNNNNNNSIEPMQQLDVSNVSPSQSVAESPGNEPVIQSNRTDLQPSNNEPTSTFNMQQLEHPLPSISEETSAWTGSRLRPRTQQQLKPYKYDYFQYDQAFRGSGMRPVRFKEYLDNARISHAAEDDDLPYEPPDEEDDGYNTVLSASITNQNPIDDSQKPAPSLMANRRRRIIEDEDDEDGNANRQMNSHRKKSQLYRGGKKKRQQNTPDSFLPSLITTENVSSVSNNENINNEKDNYIYNDNINGNDTNPEIELEASATVHIDKSPSPKQLGVAKRKMGSRIHERRPITISDATEDNDGELSRENIPNIIHISDYESDDDRFLSNDNDRWRGYDGGLSTKNNIDYGDFEVIESDYIDPMPSRPSKRKATPGPNRSGPKQPIDKSVPKISISSTKNKRHGSESSKRQTRIENFNYMRQKKTSLKKNFHNDYRGNNGSNSSSSVPHHSDKFLPLGDHGEESDQGTEFPPRDPSFTKKRRRVQPPISSRLTELQKSRPIYMTSVLEAESGKYAIRRSSKNRKTSNRQHLSHNNHQTTTSIGDLPPLPGEMDSTVDWNDVTDDSNGTDNNGPLSNGNDISMGPSPHKNAHTSSWNNVLGMFRYLSGQFDGVQPEVNPFFDLTGVVGSGLLYSVLNNQSTDPSETESIHHFGSELGSIDLDETDINVSERLYQCGETIKEWVRFALLNPSEKRHYRLEQVYEFGQFVLKSAVSGKLAEKEFKQAESIFVSLSHYSSEQWENIPDFLRSMDYDFPVFSLISSLFTILLLYRKLKNSGDPYEIYPEFLKTSEKALMNLSGMGPESFKKEYQRILANNHAKVGKATYIETIYAVMLILNTTGILYQKRGRMLGNLSFFSILNNLFPVPYYSRENMAYVDSLWGYTFAYSTIGLFGNCPNRKNSWDLVSAIGNSLINAFVQNEYWNVKQLRGYLIRCLKLITQMKWPIDGDMIKMIYRFFSAPSRKFRNIEIKGSSNFPAFLNNDKLIYTIKESDTVFHLFLKLTAITIMTLKNGSSEDLKSLKSLSGRIRPLGFRKLNRDCQLDSDELEALSNDFSIYLTLYRFCPSSCGRPTIPQLRDRLNLKESHIMARKVSLKAWFMVMKMTGDNGKLEEVMAWFEDLLEISLKEHEQCQGDTALLFHFKEKNIKAYEDFLHTTLKLLPLVLSDINLILRIPNWYKILSKHVMEVLQHELPLELKEVVLTTATSYISSHKQLEALSGGIDDDSQEQQENIDGNVNPYAFHFSSVVFEGLHQFMNDSFAALFDISDNFFENLIQSWVQSVQYVVNNRLRDWQDFFEGYSKYSWNMLIENDRKEKFEPLWMALVSDDAYEIERDLFLNSFFCQLVRAKPQGYEYRLFNELRHKDPINRWLGTEMENRQLSSSQFIQNREKIIRRMLKKMDMPSDKKYAKRFLETLKKEYRDHQRLHRGSTNNENMDFMLLVEDIINDARLYHSDVMGQNWFANNFPEVSDMSMYGYTRRETSNEIFLACVVSRLDMSLKLKTLKTFEKALELALIPEEFDLEEKSKLELLKKYRRLFSEKILPSYIWMALEKDHAIPMLIPLMNSFVNVYSNLLLGNEVNLEEITSLRGFFDYTSPLLRNSHFTLEQKKNYWELVSLVFSFLAKILEWTSVRRGSGIMTETFDNYYNLGIVLINRLWNLNVDGASETLPLHHSNHRVKSQVRRSVESFSWDYRNDCLLDNQGNKIENTTIIELEIGFAKAKHHLLKFLGNYIDRKGDDRQAMDLVELIKQSNDEEKDSILTWLFQNSKNITGVEDYYATTIDEIIL